MKRYESIIILKGQMTEENAKKEFEKIQKYFINVKIFIKENDVNGFIGKRNLAYTIQDNTTGYYIINHFTGNETDIVEIEQNLRINNNVIKFITIRRTEEIKEN